MKKRSLFAAVAMLIVSALVLTSATYAWFTAGGNATIGKIQGVTMEAGTGVMVKTTVAGSNWKGSIAQAEFTGTNDKILANGTNLTYHPVSSVDGAEFCAYTIDSGLTFVADEGTISNYYDTYQFYVGTLTAGDTVTAAPTIGGDAAGSARVALFVQNGTGWTQVGLWSGTTEANPTAIVSDATLTNVVDNGNYILDSSDTGFNDSQVASQVITGTSGNTANLTGVTQYTAANPKLYKVVTWIEGNDAGCTPTNLGGDALEVTWTFAASTPTP